MFWVAQGCSLSFDDFLFPSGLIFIAWTAAVPKNEYISEEPAMLSNASPSPIFYMHPYWIWKPSILCDITISLFYLHIYRIIYTCCLGWKPPLLLHSNSSSGPTGHKWRQRWRQHSLAGNEAAVQRVSQWPVTDAWKLGCSSIEVLGMTHNEWSKTKKSASFMIRLTPSSWNSFSSGRLFMGCQRINSWLLHVDQESADIVEIGGWSSQMLARRPSSWWKKSANCTKRALNAQLQLTRAEICWVRNGS